MRPSKPGDAIFGIRADGNLMKPGFPSIAEAEAAAGGFFAKGYKKVEIVDRVSGRVVKSVLKRVVL